MLHACTQRKDVKWTYGLFISLTFSVTHRWKHMHTQKLKQTHLCFIALICLVGSWLRSHTDPMSCDTIHMKPMKTTHTHTESKHVCRTTYGSELTRTILIKLMRCTLMEMNWESFFHVIHTHLPIFCSNFLSHLCVWSLNMSVANINESFEVCSKLNVWFVCPWQKAGSYCYHIAFAY